MKTINILGVEFKVSYVDCVDKFSPKKGEINYLTNEIRIDDSMPKDLKNQVLCHEIMHAIFDLLGMDEQAENEQMVQSLATAVHQVFKSQSIFS